MAVEHAAELLLWIVAGGEPWDFQRGDIMAIRETPFSWGSDEVYPQFTKVVVTDATYAEMYPEYETWYYDPEIDENIYRRYNVPVDSISSIDFSVYDDIDNDPNLTDEEKYEQKEAIKFNIVLADIVDKMAA